MIDTKKLKDSAGETQALLTKEPKASNESITTPPAVTKTVESSQCSFLYSSGRAVGDCCDAFIECMNRPNASYVIPSMS